MSREGAVAAHRVWKRFRSDRPTPQLSEHLGRLRRGARGGFRWALRDVSVEIEPGGSLALIGANGSGKSTLLKILGGVMDPYAGAVRVGGRVGALIEVRAGIHPELTGRENIVLAGTLMGLRRREVGRRLEEIAAFAELETAIDRPVKYYSSGMQMRLGFAVAVFLEPDVLLVDEVLAVGDASFQQRCLDRMRAVLAAGTTLVFVSHDLAALEATCTQGLWLREGETASQGSVRDALADYRAWVELSADARRDSGGEVRLVSIGVSPGGGDALPRSDGDIEIRLVLGSNRSRHATVCIGISEGTAAPAFVVRGDIGLYAGETEVVCGLRHLPLPGGRFSVWTGVFDNEIDLLPWQPATLLETVGPQLDRLPRGIIRFAPVHVSASWTAMPVEVAERPGVEGTVEPMQGRREPA